MAPWFYKNSLKTIAHCVAAILLLLATNTVILNHVTYLMSPFNLKIVSWNYRTPLQAENLNIVELQLH